MDTITPTRVVVVTGAGTGIGRATARAFARQGATVVAVGRREEPLREAAEGHPGIRPFVADVTAEGAAEEIVEAAVTAHGRLDVLVNNAGISSGGPLGTLDRSVITPLLETNLVAPVLLTQAAVPALKECRGVVVNVSTAIGQRGWPANSVYPATKSALETLTRCWALELAPDGVRVVAVAPGAIETPIADHMGLSPERLAALRAWQLAHTPMGRLGRAEEVARVITSLAAPDAGFLTGTVVPVDGGALVT
ncbi:3-oxoacyl-[acyl-carrier protein] reductase [Streptomyces venezuelae]|uniref:SDR family NAD(P)-dependent oxidoreductase n=1 Tax=Streptomyces gardneri TaxID=66892 RepID=UPI0006BC627E|nr:SDR family oxidoreductase [Streptomyces gardneri]ALO07597.1 3-oxoacyl-[acyl-carrier protein] reductase [Streptomyces venezuelae]QPK44908.1 SDR family oxidoreductase [Streptomyces gardneri]WRK36222.1 SDR family oxidoreductase [Streptomyces venezuelae]CUM42076.1 3-oxoacyl-[acyl-carrier protein] reductase [Streptomyces venezuelae]